MPRLFDVPSYRTSHFIERRKPLEDIKHHLKPRGENSSPSVFVLKGMGGCGKSQLALEFCHRAKNNDSYSAIFWIDATSSESTNQSFNSIAKTISKTAINMADNEANVQLVRNELSSWSQPWLLVFDNFDDPNSFISKSITDYFPQVGRGSILVTSRHSDTTRLGRYFEVDTMSQEEALELLFARSRTERTEANLKHGEAIVNRLGLHALAIDQAGAYVSSRNLDLELYLGHYNARTEKVLRETPGIWEYMKAPKESPEAKRKLSVFTTWELSFYQVSGDSPERERKGHILTLLAFFDNNYIWEGLFELYANRPNNWITATAHWDPYDFQDTLRELWTLSLLQSYQIQSPGAVCSLHPLIQDWIKFRINREHQQTYAVEAVRVLYDFLDPHIPDHFSDFTFATKQLIFAHIEAVLTNTERLFNSDAFLTDLDLLRGARAFSVFLREYGKYESAEKLIRTAVEGRTRLLGERDEATLLAMEDLANVLINQNKYEECEPIIRKVVEFKTQIFGEEDEVTLTSIGYLIESLHGQGKNKEALNISQKVLAIRQAVLGDEHRDTLTSIHNLARALEAQGRLEEAEPLYRKDLALSAKINGAEHTETLTSLYNLAGLLSKREQFDEAEVLYRESITLREKVMGKEHPRTLSSMHNLAWNLENQGKYHEAEVLSRETISLRVKILGKEHTDTLSSMHNLAWNLDKQAKYSESELLFQEVLASNEKQLGKDDPKTLNSVRLLIDVFEEQGKVEEAEELRRRFPALESFVS